MADRSIKVTIGANVTGLVSGLKTAAQATKDLDGRMQSWVQRNKADIGTVSTGMLAMGGAMVAGAGLVTKAAMDWESAWAGVLKTVDGTPEQIAALEGELRELAKTLPASHTEIAAVAEAAGQLGVKVGDVASFTKTMIDLGETTNLSADQAATSLARFSNIMGTSNRDVGKLGASLVGLGNNFATTEAEIMDMSMRLAGAGRQAGLSEGQVMGLAAAMSSVGIEAEAGGTAMSLTMKRIAKSVGEGGASLETFARLSGMTTEQFKQAWRTDAAGALNAFVTGLGAADAAGENVNATLETLGITGIRESDALLRLSSAGELMGSAMTQGAQEYADGTALVEEANKRYETSASRVQVAINSIKDAAIEFGSASAPMIGDLADGVSLVAQKFGDLPSGVQAATTAIAGAGGFALLAVGGLGKVVTSISDARLAMGNLGISMRTAGLAAGALGGALAIGTLAFTAWASAQADAKARTEGFIQTLDEMGNRTEATVQQINASLSDLDSRDLGDMIFGRDAESMIDKAERFGLAIEDLQGYILGQSDAVERVNAAMSAYNETLPGYQVDIDGTSGATRRFVGELDKQASSLTDAEKKAGQKALADEAAGVAAEDAATSTDTATSALERYADELSSGKGEIEGYSDALKELVDLQREAAGVVLSQREAERRFEQAVQGARDAVEEQIGALASKYEAQGWTAEAARAQAEEEVRLADKLDISTEAGRKNQAALDGIADSGWDLLDSMRENGATQGELQGAMQRTRDAFIQTAREMGMSEAAANALADELRLIPRDIDVNVAAHTAAASSQIAQFIRDASGRTVWVDVKTRGSVVRPGQVGMYAEGGAVRGPGTGTSDSIPAWLSNGEFVMKAAAVQRYGLGMMHAINGLHLANGGEASYNPRPVLGTYTPQPVRRGWGEAPIQPPIDYDRLASAIVRAQESGPLAAVAREVAGVAGGSTRWSRQGAR